MSSLLATFSLSGILYCIILSLHSLGVLSLEFPVSFPQCLLKSFSRKSRITISFFANDQKVLSRRGLE
jgi:hypothetical protein